MGSGSISEKRYFGMSLVISNAPKGDVGTFSYSNLGYTIAGVIAEKLYDQSYEDIVAEQIFTPLGLSSCGFGAPYTGADDLITQPWGHDVTRNPVNIYNWPEFLELVQITTPAGGVHCSIGDFAAYTAWHLEGEAQGTAELSQEAFNKLHTEVDDGYGLGWSVVQRNWAEGTAFWHEGAFAGFKSVMWLAPNKDFAVVVTANLQTSVTEDDARWACDSVVVAAIQEYLD
jgi:CubicO group peptidase (beta-lactamase class C family)